MAKMFTGNLLSHTSRIVSILAVLLASIAFIIAIIIYQLPKNRLGSGDRGPSGEADAFPLVVVSSLCEEQTFVSRKHKMLIKLISRWGYPSFGMPWS